MSCRCAPIALGINTTCPPIARTCCITRQPQMRGGKDYDSAWGTRMRGEGPFANFVAMCFAKAYRRIGFGRLPALDVSRSIKPGVPPRSPAGAAADPSQRSLF